MLTKDNLITILRNLDGKNYKAYGQIKNSYQFPEFKLIIDRVQGDPFATPSQLRIQIPQSLAQFPEFLYDSPIRNIALTDYLIRQFNQACKLIIISRGTGKSGMIGLPRIGQKVLKRSAILLNNQEIEVRLTAGLPARGRSILGHQAVAMLTEDLPKIYEMSLKYQSLDSQAIEKHVKVVEDADSLRKELSNQGLVAFIANGSILPRKSGVDESPLEEGAIPFLSPASLEVTMNCPNLGKVTGMGIKAGVTLIVGGGYHGKSTILKAIAAGVYNHIPGDGRELVVTEPTAMKIRAEDGRSVAGVDISPFIEKLPDNRSTEKFTTSNASGSTSQAANIIEAIEAGSKLLLIDEDTSATNLMIRDNRMQALIGKDSEPITPFIDKVRQLLSNYQVSTILVMGGSGDYLDVADTVIALTNFHTKDVTAKTQEIITNYPTRRINEGGEEFGSIRQRVIINDSISLNSGQKAVKYKIIGKNQLILGKENIDLNQVEQLVDEDQLRAIALGIIHAKKKYINYSAPLGVILDLVIKDIQSQEGLDILSEFSQGNLAEFRKLELAAAINRIRSLQTL